MVTCFFLCFVAPWSPWWLSSHITHYLFILTTTVHRVCYRSSTRSDVAVICEQRPRHFIWRLHPCRVPVNASFGGEVIVYFRLFESISCRRQLPFSSMLPDGICRYHKLMLSIKVVMPSHVLVHFFMRTVCSARIKTNSSRLRVSQLVPVSVACDLIFIYYSESHIHWIQTRKVKA